MRDVTTFLLVLASTGLLVPLGACTGSVAGPSSRTALRITNRVAGTHHRLLVHDGIWYQAHGTDLLVLDASDGDPIGRVSLARPGTAGPLVDLVLANGRLLGLLEETAVVELDLSRPRAPVVVRRHDVTVLGMRPRRLRLVDDIVHVLGPGGVVRLGAGPPERVLTPLSGEVRDVEGLMRTSAGLTWCGGRRIFAVDDGAYLGSASDLLPMPDDANVAPGTCVFVRHDRSPSGGRPRAAVGLMTPAFREIDIDRATVVLDGPLHRVRVIGNRIYIVTQREVRVLAMAPDRVQEMLRLAITGARDASPIGTNHLAVCGTFGRALYRIAADADGPGATWVRVVRAPGGLREAVSDGRFVVAGSSTGAWRWEIGRSARLVEDAPEGVHRDDVVEALTWRAVIAEDRRSLSLQRSGASKTTWRSPGGATISSAAAIDGDLWIGHDHGITLLVPATMSESTLHLAGPVLLLRPLLGGGGAAYAARDEGFGIVRRTALDNRG